MQIFFGRPGPDKTKIKADRKLHIVQRAQIAIVKCKVPTRSDTVIFETHPVIFETNPVIFEQSHFILQTNAAVLETDQAIFKTN